MTIQTDKTASKRGRGRPRLQAQPCTIRIGVPLTLSDNQALLALVESSNQSGGKTSKQEIIRQLIRKGALALNESLQE
jgi:CO dehydrogenase/acetyl-CoA synthase alpha subunit